MPRYEAGDGLSCIHRANGHFRLHYRIPRAAPQPIPNHCQVPDTAYPGLWYLRPLRGSSANSMYYRYYQDQRLKTHKFFTHSPISPLAYSPFGRLKTWNLCLDHLGLGACTCVLLYSIWSKQFKRSKQSERSERSEQSLKH